MISLQKRRGSNDSRNLAGMDDGNLAGCRLSGEYDNIPETWQMVLSTRMKVEPPTPNKTLPTPHYARLGFERHWKWYISDVALAWLQKQYHITFVS